MTEIKDEHVDWAVIDRLRKMLVAPPATDYEVSLSYSLFGTILCWTMQHIRIGTQRNGIRDSADKLADGLLGDLRKQSASDLPWRCNLEIRNRPIQKMWEVFSTDIEEFDLNTFGLLKMLRDAIAHGDKRKVRPIHESAGNVDRKLVGFEVQLEWKEGKDFGTVRLKHQDIIRIGATLAKKYCDKLQSTASDSHFGQNAEQHVKEKMTSKEAA